MTFYELLLSKGLQVESASEQGEIKGVITIDQMQLLSDAVSEYFHPAEYAELLTYRASLQTVRTEFQNMVTRLEQIQGAINPTNTQVIQAVKDEALYIERILKVFAKIAQNSSIVQRL